MSTGVSASQRPDEGARQRDFLVGFTQRRLLQRLARLDAAAGQRDLAAVAQRIGPQGDDDVRDVVDGKEQEQAGGVPTRAGSSPVRQLRGGIGASCCCAATPGSGRAVPSPESSVPRCSARDEGSTDRGATPGARSNAGGGTPE